MVIHWVLVDVTVAVGSQALQVAGSVLVLTAGVLLLSHSPQVCGSVVVVLVLTAGVLLVDEAHSLHVCGSAVVVLVLTAGVLLVDEAHSLHG